MRVEKQFTKRQLIALAHPCRSSQEGRDLRFMRVEGDIASHLTFDLYRDEELPMQQRRLGSWHSTVCFVSLQPVSDWGPEGVRPLRVLSNLLKGVGKHEPILRVGAQGLQVHAFVEATMGEIAAALRASEGKTRGP